MNKYSLIAYLISFVIVLTVIFLLSDSDRDLVMKVGAALVSALVVQQIVKKVTQNAKHVDQQKQKLEAPSSKQSAQSVIPPSNPYAEYDPKTDPELKVGLGNDMFEPYDWK
jgi:hypothetical protein